jgi:hypothetical protein
MVILCISLAPAGFSVELLLGKHHREQCLAELAEVRRLPPYAVDDEATVWTF